MARCLERFLSKAICLYFQLISVSIINQRTEGSVSRSSTLTITTKNGRLQVILFLLAISCMDAIKLQKNYQNGNWLIYLPITEICEI